MLKNKKNFKKIPFYSLVYKIFFDTIIVIKKSNVLDYIWLG